MTSVFASRRRAEEFDSLVEAPAPRALRDGHLEEFLAIVESLRAVPDAEPRPAFVSSLRDELMSAADTLLVPASDDRLTLPARNPRRDRRIAVAIGGLALVGAGTSMAVAAQSALPGEMLYPLKRAIENAETGVASSPDAKARTLLDSATSRLHEVQALGREGDLGAEGQVVSTSFTDFGSQANEATDYILDDYAETGDRDLIRELRDFAGASMATLEDLEDQVPPEARDELAAAVRVVSDIDARARHACPTCGGAGVDQIPPVLLSSAATDAPVVVIPGATVKAWRSEPNGPKSGGGDGGGDDGGAGDGAGSVTGSLVGSDGDGSGGGDTGPTDPLGDLADDLTGDDPTTSDKGDVNVGGVDVGGTVKDTVDDTKKVVDDTTKKVEDTVDDLGDSLLGN
jgi:hypothetical protein